MAARPDDSPSTRSTPAGPSWVCPFCGKTFTHIRPSCTGCGGNLVVPVEDRWVYENILPLCGRTCDV